MDIREEVPGGHRLDDEEHSLEGITIEQARQSV